jgi:hypothetical protein
MARVISAEVFPALARARNATRGHECDEPREFVVVKPNSMHTAHIDDDPGELSEVRPVHRLSALETRDIRNPARIVSWRKKDLTRALRIKPNEQVFKHAHRNEHAATARTLVACDFASVEIAERAALERFGAPRTRRIGWIKKRFEAKRFSAPRALARSRRLQGETSPTPNRVEADVASSASSCGRRTHEAAARANQLRFDAQRFATDSIRIACSAMTFRGHRAPGTNHGHLTARTTNRSPRERRGQFAITCAASRRNERAHRNPVRVC